MRDRRTVLTLVLMPLLLYPLLSVAFRQFLLSGAVGCADAEVPARDTVRGGRPAIFGFLAHGEESLKSAGSIRREGRNSRPDAIPLPSWESVVEIRSRQRPSNGGTSTSRCGRSRPARSA